MSARVEPVEASLDHRCCSMAMTDPVKPISRRCDRIAYIFPRRRPLFDPVSGLSAGC